MGDDIVERLRAVSERYRYNTPQHLAENIDAAADEIERLREAGEVLAFIASVYASQNAQVKRAIAAWEAARRG